jgi:microcystin-dependent protein
MITIYSHGNITYGNSILSLPSTSCDLVTTTDSLPIGCVTAYAGHNTPPTGWLFCDGSEKNKTDASYSALFNIIGYTYGGSGNTFNLPKMISDASYGIFPAGSATIENTGFNVNGTLKITNIHGNTNQKIGANQIPLHTHNIPSHTHDIPSHTHNIPSHTHDIPSHTHSIPSHTHSIPTNQDVTSIDLYNPLGFSKNTRMGGGGNGRRIIPYDSSYNTNSTYWEIYNFPTSLDNASLTLDNASLTLDNTSLTLGNTSVTSGNTSVTSNNNTSSENDYLPNYTAFLWIIKYN